MDGRAVVSYLVAGVFGLAVLLKIGLPLSAARGEAFGPLLANCGPAIGGFVSGNASISWVEPAITCFTGAYGFLVIPGALGIAYAFFKAASP